MKKIIETLKSFYGVAASIGVIIPGFSFFSNYTPPLFKGISLLTCALSVAVIVLISNNENRKINNEAKQKIFSSLSVKLLTASFILILFFLFLMDYTTIVPQEFPDERWQAGFGLQTWSMTDDANKLMQQSECNESKELLLSCCGIKKECVANLWKPSSIYAAGFLLILLFTVSSLCWSAGWTYLAKLHLIKNKKP